MGRILAISVSIVLLIVFAINEPYTMAKPNTPQEKGELVFNEKDLWGNVVAEGASGKLSYNYEGNKFDYEFNAIGLEPNKDYALIRSFEPQTNLPYRFEDIEEGTSDDQGNLTINGSYNFNIDLISAEFLLVPVEMLELLTDGRPSPSGRYLSGQGLIGYDDTNAELKCGCQASGISFELVGIPIGEKAVDFTLRTATDEGFNLYEYLGEEMKPLVMVFGAYT